MPCCRLFTSGSLSRLETALFQGIEEQKQGDAFRPVVVLCASGFLGHYLSRELVRRGSPHLGISFLTCNDLARTLARRALLEKKLAPIPDGGKALIARKLLRNLPAQSYFSGVQDHVHLPEILTATFTDIADSRMDFAAAARSAKLKSAASVRKVSEVAELYGCYCTALRRHVFTEADLLALASDYAATFAGHFSTDVLLVYGFYEMTGAQRELLERLLEHVNLTGFLTAEAGDRFRSAETLRDWWRARAVVEEELGPENVATDLGAVRAHVFTERTSTRDDDGSVRVLSCPDEVDEGREIAREALRLQRSAGIPFTDMAVLVRDPAYLPQLAATFEQIGIPFYLREGLPLSGTAVGRSVLAALRLPQVKYNRAEVMQWLTLGALDLRALTADGAKALVELWDRLSSEAGIVEGEMQWRDRLNALIAGCSEQSQQIAAERRPALVYRCEQAGKLLAFAEQLFVIGAEWMHARTWTALTDSSLAFLRRFHPRSPERDEVQEALSSLRHLDPFGEPTTVAEFTAAAEAVLADRSRKVGALAQTGIHVLPLSAGRHTRFRVVFVPGLTERSFPMVGRQDPILLDEERRALSPGDAPGLPLKSLRLHEERLLFLLAVAAARERLVLTVPRADAGSGAAKVPSYYLLQALECLSGRQASYADLTRPAADLSRLVYIRKSRLFEHDSRTAIDTREFDLGKVKACLESAYPESSRYLERLSPNFVRAIEAEQAQWRTASLTAYDGVLASTACQGALADLFCDEHVYSATALERYATCPYHFFLSDVLHLNELEEPAAVDDIDPRDKGELLHAILHDFYLEMKQQKKLPLVPACWKHYRERLARICARHFRRVEGGGFTGLAGTWNVQQKVILQDLERYLQLEMERGAEWLPEEFERAFGMGGSATVDVPFVRGVIKLRGKIDRVDLSHDGSAARVVDYKSGKARHKKTVDLAGGAALQLPLYLLAATKLYPKIRLRESVAEYCYITRRGEWKTARFTGEMLTEKETDISEILRTIVAGCRSGMFLRCPETQNAMVCDNCEYASVGDPRREALWQRKQADPRLDSFRRMRSKV